jgi:prepilin-type processing-associated H-X9-DG protein
MPRFSREDERPLPAETGTNKLAVFSLVFSLLGLICLPFIGAIIGGILGIVALAQISSSPRSGGRGLAIAGVVIGAIGFVMGGPLLLIALLLPAVQKVREAANRMKDANNMKQIAIAMHNYHGDYNIMPPPAILSKEGKPLLSWRVAILPYIEQDALYKQFHLDEPWDSPHNIQLLEQMPKTYEAPNRPAERRGWTYYQAFVGKYAIMDPTEKVSLGAVSAQDGTANTLLLTEGAEAVPWTKPDDLIFDFNPGTPLPAFGDRANVLFGDGSVRQMRRNIDPEALRSLIDRRDGRLPDMRAFE